VKLRLRHNAIRLRLDRADLARLAETGRVEEAVVLDGPSRPSLGYALEIASGATEVTARLDGSRLTVTLPEAAARRWLAREDDAGIVATQRPTGGDPTDGVGPDLEILVERDFPCAHRPGEDGGG
jgi:hypothetical protein